MLNILCVAEKPSIAKSVAFFLSGGQNYTTHNTKCKYVKNYTFNSSFRGIPCKITVTALLGHLMSVDFPPRYRSWSSCNPVELFHANVEKQILEKDVASNLQKEARNAEHLVIWTDCDREGEAIGCEVASVCSSVNQRIQVHRARFAVIQRNDIVRAWENLDVLDSKQAQAVEARSELDLRIGAAFTRMQTLHLQNVLNSSTPISYGSCQFPTLYFVVDRYKRIREFKPEPYWSLDVVVSDPKNINNVCKVNWSRVNLFDFRTAFIIFEECLEYSTALVTSVHKTPSRKFPPFPLNTVEMQKFASIHLGMSGDVTMKVAEQLYQRGFISYPRTETDSFSSDFRIMPLIQAQTHDQTWGNYARMLADRESGMFNFPRKGKSNDNAHPPIHPTEQIPGNLNSNESKLYNFIVRRFLACCSKPAEGNSTVATISIGTELFSASGLIILNKGYMEIYPWDKWTSDTIPEFISEGAQLAISKIKLNEKHTTKPNLLTEAELITLMEKNGIGTDATIHEHIAKILQREYANKTGKYFIPSILGTSLIEAYDRMKMRLSLAKPYLRAKMEINMQLICDGKKSKVSVIDETIREYEDAFMQAYRQLGRFTESLRANSALSG